MGWLLNIAWYLLVVGGMIGMICLILLGYLIWFADRWHAARAAKSEADRDDS